MTKLHGSWIWYELLTPDAAASKAFYEAVVPGWSLADGGPDMNGYGFISRGDGGMTGGYMPISADMRAHGARPCWLGYIGVDDCDAAVKAIEVAGGKCLMPPQDIAMAGRIAMVADCCGAPFYVMTPSPQDGEGGSTAFAAERRDGSIGWNELSAGNQTNAIAFYTGLFGWGLPEPMDMGPMGSYQFIDHGGVTHGAIMQKPKEVPVPVWSHFIWVPSLMAAHEAALANGANVFFGPMEVPGDDWVFQGMDPQGAIFSIVGPK